MGSGENAAPPDQKMALFGLDGRTTVQLQAVQIKPDWATVALQDVKGKRRLLSARAKTVSLNALARCHHRLATRCPLRSCALRRRCGQQAAGNGASDMAISGAQAAGVDGRLSLVEAQHPGEWELFQVIQEHPGAQIGDGRLVPAGGVNTPRPGVLHYQGLIVCIDLTLKVRQNLAVRGLTVSRGGLSGSSGRSQECQTPLGA
eukprot:8298737-Pyramimonas_sp.AAC.1